MYAFSVVINEITAGAVETLNGRIHLNALISVFHCCSAEEKKKYKIQIVSDTNAGGVELKKPLVLVRVFLKALQYYNVCGRVVSSR